MPNPNPIITVARFALPEPTATAVVLGEFPGIGEALALAGITLLPIDAAARANVVLTDRAHLETVFRDNEARAIVVAGRVRSHQLLRAGYCVDTYIVRSGAHVPRIVVGSRSHRAQRKLLLERAVAAPRRLRARNALLAVLLRAGWTPPHSTFTVATRVPGAPFVVRAAQQHGVPTDVEWFLDLREGAPQQRWSYQMFPATAAVDEPPSRGWIVKFGAAPDARDGSAADAAGLAGITAVAPVAAQRVPRLLGRGNVGGLEYTVETIGGLLTLSVALQATWHRETNGALVSNVIDWILAMNCESAVDERATDVERARLETEVLARWREVGLRSDPLDRLSEVPGTAIHGDLGPWNVLVDGAAFTVIDWERFRPAGLALWDLISFATECYAAIGAPRTGWIERRLALLRGELETSELLFATVERGLAALDLDPAVAGALATMRWLAFAIEDHPDPFGADSKPAQMARAWVEDPVLGIDWTAWTTWRRDRG